MNSQIEEIAPLARKKEWTAPEIHEQTIQSATAKGKAATPGEPSSTIGPSS